MGNLEDPKQDPVRDAATVEARRPFYRNSKFWAWALGFVATLLGLLLGWTSTAVQKSLVREKRKPGYSRLLMASN